MVAEDEYAPVGLFSKCHNSDCQTVADVGFSVFV